MLETINKKILKSSFNLEILNIGSFIVKYFMRKREYKFIVGIGIIVFII